MPAAGPHALVPYANLPDYMDGVSKSSLRGFLPTTGDPSSISRYILSTTSLRRSVHPIGFRPTMSRMPRYKDSVQVSRSS